MSQSSLTAVVERKPNYDTCCRTIVKSTTFSFVWKIENFSLYFAEAKSTIESLTFDIKSGNLATQWKLQLYPFGDCDETAIDDLSLGLYLWRVDNGAAAFVRFQCYFMKANGFIENFKQSQIRQFYRIQNPAWGWKTFIKRSELLKTESNLLPNNQLTICCDATIQNGTSSTLKTNDFPAKYALDHLSQELESLLEKEKFTDVTLVVGVRHFQAHKAILATRSPVFEAMFENDFEENKDNLVKIEDIDEEILEKVLQFLYTGKEPVMKNVETAEELIYAANKYALSDLQNMCERVLSGMVTLENAVKLLILADRFKLKSLNDDINDFVIPRITDLIETSEWKMLKKDHLDIACNVLEMTAMKKLCVNDAK